MDPWWDRWPGLLEDELEALEREGFSYEPDEDARNQHGIIRLRVRAQVQGEEQDLIVTYPDLYPYFRFEIQAPGLELQHHQNPFNSALCLIGRATENWEVDDTLAAFLKERLDLTVEAGSSEDVRHVDPIEEHQAEPVTDFYPYERGAVLLVDSAWTLPAESGEFAIGLERTNPPALVRGAVLDVFDSSRTVIASAAPKLRDLYPIAVRGRWVRSPEPVREGETTRFLDRLVNLRSDLARPMWQNVGAARLDIAAAVFPEEVGWREHGEAWTFIVRFRQLGRS